MLPVGVAAVAYQTFPVSDRLSPKNTMLSMESAAAGAATMAVANSASTLDKKRFLRVITGCPCELLACIEFKTHF